MRRTPLLIAAVSLVAAATPAALLAHPSDGPKGDPGTHHPGTHKDPKGPLGPKGTNYLFHACVTADATETAVNLSVLHANRHARRALDGATTFTATLNVDTKIRLAGKARKAPEGSTEKRLPRIGTWDNLDAGDVVTIRYRAPRGTLVADLGPAAKVTDHGPRAKKCPVPVADPKPKDPPTTDTPPTTTAPAS
ncbi:MAG: hypothetical protein AB7O78_04765 [Thermoleophilia bacterium]